MQRGDEVGNYLIEEELGAGGMARVYRVRHTTLGTLHALKVLEPRFRGVPEVRARFLAEARIQASLLHDHVVRVTDTVSTPDVAGFVMELVSGSTLEQHVETLGRPLDACELRAIFTPILDALGEAHRRGVIHRDIKPGNILLASGPRGIIPKLADFGIAKVTEPLEGESARNVSTHLDARMGTIAYMSPEQIERVKSVTPRSDIFSMGATLYEAATATAAFDGHSEFEIMRKIVDGRFVPPAERHPGIDARIAAAITRAMNPAPGARFASCEELVAALGAAAPVAVEPVEPVEAVEPEAAAFATSPAFAEPLGELEPVSLRPTRRRGNPLVAAAIFVGLLFLMAIWPRQCTRRGAGVARVNTPTAVAPKPATPRPTPVTADDLSHRLFFAAVTLRDPALLNRVTWRFGLTDQHGAATPLMTPFVAQHQAWTAHNSRWMVQLNASPTAAANYVRAQHEPNYQLP